MTYPPFRWKAGTGDLFRLACRKSCLRMPHSPDRTATTNKLVHPNRSVVSVHFDGIPPCPIRLRVPHPSSFPKESGIGRPGTAGLSAYKPDRNDGPFSWKAGTGVACHAFSRWRSCLKTRAIVGSDGNTQIASFFAPSPLCSTHDPGTGPVRSTECARLSFSPREKWDWPPSGGGPFNRLPA
jgi:hypothetical protein